MNGYLLILGLPVLVTILSYYKETNEPIFKIKKGKHNYPLILFYRYLHYVIYCYFAMIPFIFNVYERNTHIDVYVLCSFLLIFSWMFLDICFLALSELNHYEVKDIYNIDTSFHPGLYVIFKKYCYGVNLFIGVFFFVHISKIIYYYPFGSIALKTLFAMFIYTGILKCLLNKKINKKYTKSKFNDFIIKYL